MTPNPHDDTQDDDLDDDTQDTEGFDYNPDAYEPDVPPKAPLGRPKSPARGHIVAAITAAAAQREPMTSAQLYPALLAQGITEGSARNAYNGLMREPCPPITKATSESALTLPDWHLAALPPVEHRAILALAKLPAAQRAPILASLYEALGLPFDPSEVFDLHASPNHTPRIPRRVQRPIVTFNE